MASEQTFINSSSISDGQAKRRPVIELEGNFHTPSRSHTYFWTKKPDEVCEPDTSSFDSFDSSTEKPPLPSKPPVGDIQRSTEHIEPSEVKPTRQIVPTSWKNFFLRWKKNVKSPPDLNFISQGVRCSPPVSPLAERKKLIENGYTIDDNYPNHNPDEPFYSDSKRETDSFFKDPNDSLERRSHTVESYGEKLKVYQLKYSYMKSWPGLLRLLCGVELIFGAMAFACVCAYIQKDNQWRSLYGNVPTYGYGGGFYGGYYYYGPMTPFVLVVESLAWLVTVILLVMGLTMYYRTILLDSNWWPVTEFAINIIMSLLYMAAGIVYINDLNRGGLCYSVFSSNPIFTAFCRIDGGQVAALIFIFLLMILYMASALVSLKMWRHIVASKQREMFDEQESSKTSDVTDMVSQTSMGVQKKQLHKQQPIAFQQRTRRIKFEDEVNPPGVKNKKSTKLIQYHEEGDNPETLSKSIPAGHTPKAHIVPDFIIKYPKIQTSDEREQYKAVFNDQYAEYKELHEEIHAALKKFQELEAILSTLPRYTDNNEEHKRIKKVVQEYKKKRNDPAFLEKKDRCDYLKRKLTHIKHQIQEYDKTTNVHNSPNFAKP
ncbi:MARVEL domain-containing protein 2 [Latimeria chalumnae]|uniref:MARVEL domain-containing protein 2 n=1 Tax=Latimeria chalumnae TaxID=7897 RepID=UPI0003C11897|nr:PREDICTED: occludin/ELL domain-containing protein 1 [Latimeria chalumnae]|eukprot:XP_006001692.1 PREDICTED: occludin/ELL domain-containing protein 1 [Latimeria chalumnae]